MPQKLIKKEIYQMILEQAQKIVFLFSQIESGTIDEEGFRQFGLSDLIEETQLEITKVKTKKFNKQLAEEEIIFKNLVLEVK